MSASVEPTMEPSRCEISPQCSCTRASGAAWRASGAAWRAAGASWEPSLRARLKGVDQILPLGIGLAVGLHVRHDVLLADRHAAVPLVGLCERLRLVVCLPGPVVALAPGLVAQDVVGLLECDEILLRVRARVTIRVHRPREHEVRLADLLVRGRRCNPKQLVERDGCGLLAHLVRPPPQSALPGRWTTAEEKQAEQKIGLPVDICVAVL